MHSIQRGYFSHQIPERWEEALLCGNGTTGAIVMGQPLNETIIFSHEKLFIPWHEKLPPVDTASHLDEIREMLRQGQFQPAADRAVALAEQAGYGKKRWSDPFFPACDLHLRLNPAGEVREYAHSLDYSTGLAAVEWQDLRGPVLRRSFVSRADGAVVLEIRGLEAFAGEIEIAQHPPDAVTDYWNGPDKFNSGLCEPVIQVEEGWLYFRGRFRKEASGYECLARVVTEGGTQRTAGSRLRVENTRHALILLKIQPLRLGETPCVEDMRAEIAALPADFDLLLARHAAIHSALYNRTSLDMGADHERPAEAIWAESRTGAPSPAYFQQIFDAGRYEILSSCGDWAPNLQGVWSGIYGVPWSGDYTQNGNVQTAIAGLLSGNLPECMDTYLRYLEFLAEESRVNARAFYNCRGVLLASRTSSHGLNNHFDATWPMTFWTAGAGWGAHFFYDSWLHTGDDEFFIRRALPYMKEVALFYEDFLVLDESGCWVFSPSYSPENHPGNTGSQACINATMDIAVARELFHNLLEGCRTLGLEQENIPKWERILAKMPPYQINRDGAVKEWCDPRFEERYDHRHASHLYPLMYGVAKELREDRRLMEAFARAYQFRVTERKKEANVMAFGSIQLAQAAVHLRDVETIWYLLQHLAAGYYFKNFATSHDRGPEIFNADLSGGMPGLILEILVQSETIQNEQGAIEGYRIHILPALPTEWKKGSINGVLVRGGFEVNLEWENGLLKNLSIRNPYGKKVFLRYCEKEVELSISSRAHLTHEFFE